MEAKTKHLEFIQTTINRMASNSFLLKGWAVTLVGGLLALNFKEVDCRNLFLSLAVVVLFWLLDGYYLSHERNFIELYNHVRKRRRIDFSMDTRGFRKWWHWIDGAFSTTLLLFYGGLAAVTLLINHYL